MSNKIQPLGGRLLAKRIEEQEQVKGGIILPDSAKEKPQEAEVIALGTGELDENGKRRPFEVKVGNRILISKYGGTEINLNGEKLVLLPESDVLAILN